MKTFTKEITNILPALDNKYKVIEDLGFSHLVNFRESFRYPLHRWYYYREGFSPELVDQLLKKYECVGEDVILDPFVGGGTTCIVAGMRGLKSFGFETNPFSAFVGRVKSRLYSKNDIESIQNLIDQMRSLDFKPSIKPPKLSIVEKLFFDESESVLEKLLMFKEFICSIKKPHIREFLLFGWLAILEKVSNSRKGGNGLKNKKRQNKNLNAYLFWQYEQMLCDLIYLIEKQGPTYINPPSIIEDTAVRLQKYIIRGSIKGAIFSPPYLNCFDYCEIYKIELWMGDFVDDYEDLKGLRTRAIRSHLNGNGNSYTHKTELGVYLPNPLIEDLLPFLSSTNLWDRRIPGMILGYFEDMSAVLKRLYSSIKTGGFCVIVVSNSAYGGIVIPTDTLLADIARECGFEVEGVRVARYMVTSSQQYNRLKDLNKYMRESLIFLKK